MPGFDEGASQPLNDDPCPTAILRGIGIGKEGNAHMERPDGSANRF